MREMGKEQENAIYAIYTQYDMIYYIYIQQLDVWRNTCSLLSVSRFIMKEGGFSFERVERSYEREVIGTEV